MIRCHTYIRHDGVGEAVKAMNRNNDIGITILDKTQRPSFPQGMSCRESRPEIGGQWAYKPNLEALEGEAPPSSDFPLDPPIYGEYLGHRRMLRYTHEYVDHFNLRNHVRACGLSFSATCQVRTGREPSHHAKRVRNGPIQAHRTSIESFAETGPKLENGTMLDVEVVIACTGYAYSAPYLPPDVVRSQDTPTNTARLAASVIAGRVKIPEDRRLEREVRKRQAWQAKAFVWSERYPTTDRYVPYIDSVLPPLGANPTLGRPVASVERWEPLRHFGR
ncbi:hypothetical protein CHU98_g2984 [Xylaria longipes]|nr:hypothetical protein CHU98_g2984 [Xylaria longipes]